MSTTTQTLSSVSKANPPRHVARSLLEVASTVTLRHALTTTWSSWHLWDHVNRHDPNPADVQDSIWPEIAPFANCVGQAHLIHNELCKALKDAGLGEYADNVRLLSTKQTATSDYDYHVVVAMPFDDFCIVCDLPMHPTAFRVRLDGAFQCEKRVQLHSRQLETTFYYGVDLNGGRTLSYVYAGHEGRQVLEFEMDHATIIRQLALPSTKQAITSDDYRGPPKKHVLLRSLFSEKPKHFSSTSTEKGYLALGTQVHVNFEERTITLQFPFEDWLQTSDFYDVVEFSPLYNPVDNAVAQLRVSLGSTADNDLGPVTKNGLLLMDSVAEELGLPRGEIVKMAKSVYRVWNAMDIKFGIPVVWPDV